MDAILISPSQLVDSDYWNGLINEDDAARFLSLSPRTLQAFRQKGGGPEYVRISSRCIRYRRSELKAWSDARVQTSTSQDQGQEAA